MIDIGIQKCFRNSKHLSRLFFSISLSHTIFSEDSHILLVQSVAFLRLRNFFDRAVLCVRCTRSVNNSFEGGSDSAALSWKNLISSLFIAQKIFVQLPSELTLIGLIALTSLGDREGFGVGNGLGVGVPLLRLSLSLVYFKAFVTLLLLHLVACVRLVIRRRRPLHLIFHATFEAVHFGTHKCVLSSFVRTCPSGSSSNSVREH